MTTSTITRTQLASGKYHYARNGETLLKASTQLYTAFAEFAAITEELGPLTLHKTAAAAMKTKGASGAGPLNERGRPTTRFYWTKLGSGLIEEAS